MPYCREYGGQKTIVPSPGKNITEYSDHHKCQEHPIVFFADFESVSKTLDHCESDPDKSATDLKSIHHCSGFSYTIISPHFPQKTVSYRGPDADARFLESVLEEEKKNQ